MDLQQHRNSFRISVAVAAVLAFVIIIAPTSKADEKFSTLSSEEAKITLGLHYMNDLREPMKGIRILTSVLEENPQNTKALALLGNFSMQTGQYEKAILRYQSLLPLVEGRDRENVLFSLANAAELAGDTTLALKSLEEIRRIAKDSLFLQSVKQRINLLQ